MSDHTPLYEAQHAPRYERQTMIRAYQERYRCRLVVLKGWLFPPSINLFEEVLFDANPDEDLHILLSTLGGDGESAIRMLRQAQSRCSSLVVIVPDQAKSAGTLFALGADRILMGPASDLGPIDPQMLLEGEFQSAKAIIAAVEDSEGRVAAEPNTFALHASLLADLSALTVQNARDAIGRTGDQLREALGASTSRSPVDVAALAEKLRGPLIDRPFSHGALISAEDAKSFGLPAELADTGSEQWRSIWALWMKYWAIPESQVFEGERASQIFGFPAGLPS